MPGAVVEEEHALLPGDDLEDGDGVTQERVDLSRLVQVAPS